jgi:hypothetical protein
MTPDQPMGWPEAIRDIIGILGLVIVLVSAYYFGTKGDE